MATELPEQEYPGRKRLRLLGHDYGEPGWAYFLTIRPREGTRPFENRRLAAEAANTLLTLQALSGVGVLAYCIMPDHVHLVCWTPDGSASIPSFVRRFKSFVARTARACGCSDRLWQRYCYDHIVRKSEDLPGMCEYVVANPVRKGLVVEVEDYPFAAFLGLP